MSSSKAKVLDGKAIANAVLEEVRRDVSFLGDQGIRPGLGVILVGEDPASQVYVRNKSLACQKVGIAVFDHRLPTHTTEAELAAQIHRLNQDPSTHGILLQLPLPEPLSSARVLSAIDPTKDVDGLLAENVGLLWQGRPRFVPCTPLGVMRLLSEADTKLRGARALIVGRSLLVGKPMAALLMAADATVTVCHSKTADLPTRIAEAQVVIAAIGQPQAILGSWIAAGATVIDVGINRLPSGQLVGDVDFSAAVERAAVITKVPGGVGPLTVAMLLKNTVLAARLQHGLTSA